MVLHLQSGQILAIVNDSGNYFEAMTHYGPRRKFPECPVILAGTFGVMDHAHIHIWAYIPKIVSSLLKVVESPDFTQSV